MAVRKVATTEDKAAQDTGVAEKEAETRKEAEPKPEPEPEPEKPKYTVDEFARAAANVFGKGTSPDIVRAAFRTNDITSATIDEAKDLVSRFAHKEVK